MPETKTSRRTIGLGLIFMIIGGFYFRINKTYKQAIIKRRLGLGLYSLAHRLRAGHNSFCHRASGYDWLDYNANRHRADALGFI